VPPPTILYNSPSAIICWLKRYGIGFQFMRRNYTSESDLDEYVLDKDGDVQGTIKNIMEEAGIDFEL
jgi:hypothetical protein